eukprot:6793210-Prymnesium_polylepis.1
MGTWAHGGHAVSVWSITMSLEMFSANARLCPVARPPSKRKRSPCGSRIQHLCPGSFTRRSADAGLAARTLAARCRCLQPAPQS